MMKYSLAKLKARALEYNSQEHKGVLENILELLYKRNGPEKYNIDDLKDVAFGLEEYRSKTPNELHRLIESFFDFIEEKEAEKLDEYEYKDCQDKIILISQLLEPLPLEKFLKQLNFANDFGCFFNPTLWSEAHQKLGEIKNLAESLLKHQKLFSDLKDRERMTRKL